MRTGDVEVDLLLGELAQHAADARDGAGREDEVEADLGRGRQLDLPQHDDGRHQQAEVHDHVDHAEHVGDGGGRPAGWRCRELARVDLVPHGRRRAALEAGPEESEEGVDGEEEEEDVVEDAPDARGHARQAAVKERDGDLDDAYGCEEKDLASYSKLGTVSWGDESENGRGQEGRTQLKRLYWA